MKLKLLNTLINLLESSQDPLQDFKALARDLGIRGIKVVPVNSTKVKDLYAMVYTDKSGSDVDLAYFTLSDPNTIYFEIANFPQEVYEIGSEAKGHLTSDLGIAKRVGYHRLNVLTLKPGNVLSDLAPFIGPAIQQALKRYRKFAAKEIDIRKTLRKVLPPEFKLKVGNVTKLLTRIMLYSRGGDLEDTVIDVKYDQNNPTKAVSVSVVYFISYGKYVLSSIDPRLFKKRGGLAKELTQKFSFIQNILWNSAGKRAIIKFTHPISQEELDSFLEYLFKRSQELNNETS